MHIRHSIKVPYIRACNIGCLAAHDNYFLFPTRRGKGILVAPGFCPASRSLVGAKPTGQFFFEFSTHGHSWQHGDVQVIFYQTCYQNLKWPPEFNSKKLCGCNFLNLKKVRNYSNFTITFPPYGNVQVNFAKFY